MNRLWDSQLCHRHARVMSRGVLGYSVVLRGFFWSWRWDVKNKWNAVDCFVGQFANFGVYLSRESKRVTSHTDQNEVKDELSRLVRWWWKMKR